MTTETMVEKAQYALFFNWEYKKKAVPNFEKVFREKIENFKSSQLISKEDKFDCRKNIDVQRKKEAQISDFIELLHIRYAPSEYVTARKNTFHYKFSHWICITYHPTCEIISYYKYHRCD